MRFNDSKVKQRHDETDVRESLDATGRIQAVHCPLQTHIDVKASLIPPFEQGSTIAGEP